jgi:hypothetical protein
VYQERVCDWYEIHQTAFGPQEGCIGELDRCNDRKICEKLALPLNKTVEAPVSSICFSVDCLELTGDHMLNKLFHTE